MAEQSMSEELSTESVKPEAAVKPSPTVTISEPSFSDIWFAGFFDSKNVGDAKTALARTIYNSTFGRFMLPH